MEHCPSVLDVKSKQKWSQTWQFANNLQLPPFTKIRIFFFCRVASTSTTAATRSRCLQQRTVRRSLLQRSFPAQCVHGSLQNKAIWIGTWRGTLHPETSLINVTIVRTTARVKPLSNTTLRYVCSLYINFYFS